MAVDSEGRTMANGRSPRFMHWLAFLIFSLITLGSSMDASNNDDDVKSKTQKWAIACSSITLSLTLIIIIMHLIPICSLFIVGTRIEGFVIILLIGFWSATAAIISDSANGLAVDESGAVSNGNLFYFSWAGFVCSITLGVSYLRSVYGVDITGEIRSRSARLSLWAALLASCLIVMGSSANIYDNKCAISSTNTSASFCRRTKLGVALGCIGVMVSLLVIAMKIATSMAPFLLEAVSGLVLFLSYIFGVAYITSEAGPGSALGNLYYSTWASSVLTFMIGSSCYEDYQAARAMTNQANLAGGAGPVIVEDDERDHKDGYGGDVQVETLDEI